MDISTFIKETLLGLKNGIQDANREAKSNYFVMMMYDKIDFDVAVTVSDQTKGKGGAKLGVASIASIGGDISIENQNAKTSRIKFSVKSQYNMFGTVPQDK